MESKSLLRRFLVLVVCLCLCLCFCEESGRERTYVLDEKNIEESLGPSFSPIATWKPSIPLSLVPTPTINPNETEHVNSVTVRIYCSLTGAIIYYSINNAEPTRESFKVNAGAPIVIDTIGLVTVKAFAVKDGFIDSKIVQRKFKILERCETPNLVPDGGTFAGSVEVSLSSSTHVLLFAMISILVILLHLKVKVVLIMVVL